MSSNAATITAALSTAATLNLTAPGAGLRHYITGLRIERHAAALLGAGTTPVVVTTINPLNAYSSKRFGLQHLHCNGNQDLGGVALATNTQQMTNVQIEHAQKISRDCLASKFKNCN